MTLATLSRRALCKASFCALAFVGLAQTAIAQDAPRVKFVTNAGEFVVEVYPDKAPKTVDNFLQYVRDKHYDGTIFHRVIGNFMVQGGGYDQRYIERRTRPPVEHEGREALAKGGPRNTVGTIAMARTNAPHSATSQFFINVVDNAFLDPHRNNPATPCLARSSLAWTPCKKFAAPPPVLVAPFHRMCHAHPSSFNRPACSKHAQPSHFIEGNTP